MPLQEPEQPTRECQHWRDLSLPPVKRGGIPGLRAERQATGSWDCELWVAAKGAAGAQSS